ncbi:hypothetical protein J1605_004698 [Eschrichtius robustus]|uniref:Uncharacterized protein n=1 Tax=Eschrichtius robustus TaxID=9764 RepID=A0AB34HGU3_ESCRO|nr:hypothetical protein J1605_004698 [Eschrichtius robustus]
MSVQSLFKDSESRFHNNDDHNAGKAAGKAMETVNRSVVARGETVTSVTSLVPLQPKKGKRRKEKADVPPAVPAKAPIAAPFHKPKLLKPQRKVALDPIQAVTSHFVVLSPLVSSNQGQCLRLSASTALTLLKSSSCIFYNVS